MIDPVEIWQKEFSDREESRDRLLASQEAAYEAACRVIESATMDSLELIECEADQFILDTMKAVATCSDDARLGAVVRSLHTVMTASAARRYVDRTVAPGSQCY